MSAQPPKGRPPGRPAAKPAQQRPAVPAQARAQVPQRQAQRPSPRQAPPSKGPGCLASLFLDLTGIGFLMGMKKKLGGGLFWFSFLSLLLLMFLAGAKIERWNHLGEANYVAQILPMASCFSPILALLMTLAFAVGDVLTTATYWLFPQDSNLNLFHLFNKSHPLLTWGAYARMDFITLPLYALLPGLGSRIAYGIASRIFQAGRAKVMHDGGPPNKEALKRQLSQALSEQQGAAQNERNASGRFEQADQAVAEKAADVQMAQGDERGAAAGVQSANADTEKYNRQAATIGEQVARTAEDADRAGKEAAKFDGFRDRADADLRQGSYREEQLKDQAASVQKQEETLQSDIKASEKVSAKLERDREEIQRALDTGVDADGKPLTPERIEAAKKALAQNDSARRLEEAKRDFAREDLAKAKAEHAKLEREAEEQSKKNEETLKIYRDAEAKAEAARRKQEQAQEQIRAKEAEAEEARRNAAASQEKAREEAARLEQARQARAQAQREFQAAAQQRNAAADRLNAARSALGSSNGKVSQLQSALGVPISPPVGPANPNLGHAGPQQAPGPVAEAPQAAPQSEGTGGGRHRPRRDPMRDVILDYDRAMYAAQAERQRWRDQLIRDWQARSQGLLPSGLGPADVGPFMGQGFGALAAAAAGGIMGSAVGAGVMHGHMWAEYNPIRVALHPSHTADVGCFKMDVGYLDQNMLGGVGDAGAVGPIGVVAAATPPPPAGPGDPPPLPSNGQTPGGPGPGPGGPGPSGETPDERAAREAAQKARAEADQYKKQWEDSESSADKSDPGYKNLKQQYDDYIKSKEDEASSAEAQADAMQSKREADEAAANEAKAYKDQWIKDRQEDLKAAAEEKAHLEAVMRGAQQAGLDTTDQQTRLNQLNGRLGELHGQLQKEGSDFDYTARDRGTISPGKEFLEAGDKMRQSKAELDYLQKLQKEAWDRGMVDPDAHGTKGDMYGRVGDQINKFLNGEKLDPAMIKQIRDAIGHRIDGTTSDQLPPPEKPWYTDGDSMKQALNETGRNISTCQTSDGKMSWPGLLGRVGIGMLTAGQSEWIFTPTGAMYKTKDAIDKGANGLEATWEGVKETIKQEIGGALIGGALKTGGSAIKGMAQAEMAGENILKGAAKGGWNGLKSTVTGGVKGVTDAFDPAAWKKTVGELGGSVKSGLQRTGDILTGQEGLVLPKGLTQGATEGAGSAMKSPLIGTPEWAAQQQARRAIATGDPDVLAGIYRDGGGKNLSDMQMKGYISGDEAKKLNTLLQAQVNGAVHDGTVSTVNRFPSETGVRVDEVIVADSGSSARGPMSRGPTARAGTDADRTLIPTFNEGDLKNYAADRGMTREQAYDELCQKFRASHEGNVSAELQNRGFGNSGGSNPADAAKNVGYGSYDRIGACSGKGDSYASGFTSSRQASQGEGTRYRTDGDGYVSGSNRVSGQSVVDQNELNKANYQGADISGRDPTAIPPKEVAEVMGQQVKGVEGHPNDPLYISKAVTRSEKIANTVNESLGDQRLTQAANEIYSDPSKMNDVLKKYGYVDAHGNPDPSKFCAQGRGSVNNYASTHEPVTPEPE